jgi:ribosomal protein S27AE
MRIAMDYEVNKVQMDREFKVCPSCGYQDGFHSMFKKDKDDITRWYFICPSCHAVFDIGLTAGPSPDQQPA